MSAQLYYRDYFTRFTPFDARAVATRGRNVDQVMQNSEVYGSRLGIEAQSWVNKPTFGANEDGEMARAQRQGGGGAVLWSLDGLRRVEQRDAVATA